MIYAPRIALPTEPLNGTLRDLGNFCSFPGSEYTADSIGIERLSLIADLPIRLARQAFIAVIGTVVPPDGSRYEWANAYELASNAFVTRAGWLLHNGYPELSPSAFFERAGIKPMAADPLNAEDAYAVTQSVLWWLLNDLGEVYTYYYACDDLARLHEKNERLRTAAEYWYELAMAVGPETPPALDADYEVFPSAAGLQLGPFRLCVSENVRLMNPTATLVPYMPHYLIDARGCRINEIGEGAFYVRVPTPCQGRTSLRVYGNAWKPGVIAMKYGKDNTPPAGLERLMAPAQIWISGNECFRFSFEVPLNTAPGEILD